MGTLLERYTNIDNTSGIAFVYRYNSKSLLSRIDLCEVSFDDTHITASTLVSSEKYYYDASDRLYKVEEVDSAETVLHSCECEFDAKENVTELVETIERTIYTYRLETGRHGDWRQGDGRTVPAPPAACTVELFRGFFFCSPAPRQS